MSKQSTFDITIHWQYPDEKVETKRLRFETAKEKAYNAALGAMIRAFSNQSGRAKVIIDVQRVAKKPAIPTI